MTLKIYTDSEVLNRAVDSDNYDILINSIKLITNLDGLTCEIGIREGGSSYKIMREKLLNNDKSIHIGIDPYGNILYPMTDSYEKYRNFWVNPQNPNETNIDRYDYTNRMKQKMLKDLYSWCCDNEMEFLYFPLEDTEFFKRYSDGIPIYDEEKKIENRYKFVFYDGPHDYESVEKEVLFFIDRMPNGVMVFDDIDNYEHNKIESILFLNNFQKFQVQSQGRAGKKASYVKN